MTLVILGRNGQIGSAASRALAPLGKVVALGRGDADLAQPGAVAQALAAIEPAIVINCAAYTAVDRAESEPDLADRINHHAVAEIGAWAAGSGATVVHYSTDYVFGGHKPGAYVEADAPAPLNAYGRSKRDGEAALAASGARHLIFRTSWVHSPIGNNFIRTMLRLAAERDSLRVVADQYGAPTSASLIADVTAQAVAAIARDTPPPSGVYHLAAAGETSWHGLAAYAIAEARDAGMTLRVAPDAILPITAGDYPLPAKRPLNSRLDTGKLRAALDVTLPDWTHHVRDTVSALVGEGGR